MKDKLLRNALIFGTAALIWSIPSLNLPGIIGSVISWAAHSRPRKSTAFAAGTAYIIAALGSVVFAVLMTYAKDFFMQDKESGIAMADIFNGMFYFSFIGIALYAAAAVFSITGGRRLPAEKPENGGFFE